MEKQYELEDLESLIEQLQECERVIMSNKGVKLKDKISSYKKCTQLAQSALSLINQAEQEIIDVDALLSQIGKELG